MTTSIFLFHKIARICMSVSPRFNLNSSSKQSSLGLSSGMTYKQKFLTPRYVLRFSATVIVALSVPPLEEFTLYTLWNKMFISFSIHNYSLIIISACSLYFFLTVLFSTTKDLSKNILFIGYLSPRTAVLLYVTAVLNFMPTNDNNSAGKTLLTTSWSGYNPL